MARGDARYRITQHRTSPEGDLDGGRAQRRKAEKKIKDELGKIFGGSGSSDPKGKKKAKKQRKKRGK